MTVIVAYPTAADQLARRASRARPTLQLPIGSGSTVIQFPTDRCRQPDTAIEATERAEYAQAIEQFAAEPRSIEAGVTMMRLACEGKASTVRRAASTWLQQNYNVRVINGEL